MHEKAKIREIMDGLERLKGEHSYFPNLERVRAICSVVPLDYPLTLSIFFKDSHAEQDYDHDLFLKFLVETGKEWGVCDDSERHPIMIYQRPDAEIQHYDYMYTADGWFYDEGNGFGDDTWGGAIDPAGRWLNNAADIVETLVDTMWDLCGGDVHVLLERLDEYDGGLRYYLQRDGFFLDEWEWRTWEAFGVWCKQQGIEQPPFPVEWSDPNNSYGWETWEE